MKNLLNGLFLSAATYTFTASAVFAQATTNVPFVGGSVNVTITNGGALNFNSATGLTPLGTATFNSGSITLRNITTGSVITPTSNNPAFTATTGDFIAGTGTGSGTFSVTSNGSSFTFTSSPTTALGQVLSVVTDPATLSRTLTNSIVGGSITLSSIPLNLVPTTSIPIVGGNFSATSSNGLNDLILGNGTFLTSLGTISTTSNEFSTINVPSANFLLQPGIFNAGNPPTTSSFGATLGGFISGNIAYNSSSGGTGSANFTNSDYIANGTVTALTPTTYNFGISGGSLLFPTSLIPTPTPSGNTNVPLIGGTVNFTNSSFISASALTPLGTATINNGNIVFSNVATGTSFGQAISAIGNGSGSFLSADGNFFSFSAAPVTILTTDSSSGRITGGGISLPTALLGIAPTTNVAILGGNFAATSSGGINNLVFGNATFLTSLGSISTSSNAFSTLDIPSANFLFRPGTFRTGTPTSSSFSATVGGFISGNLTFANGSNTNFPASEYNLNGVLTTASPTSYTLAIANGNLQFPTSLISSPTTGNGLTNVPFTGGSFSVTLTDSNVVTYNSSTILSPLGTLTIGSGDATTLINQRTNFVIAPASNSYISIRGGFSSTDIGSVGDSIGTAGTVSGTFAPLSSATFSFTNAPIFAGGRIQSIVRTSSGRVISSNIINSDGNPFSGSIALPTSSLGLPPTTIVPILGGNFAFNATGFGNATFLTSLGTVTSVSNAISRLFASFGSPGNALFEPGTFDFGTGTALSSSSSIPYSIDGFISGNIALTSGGSTSFRNAQYSANAIQPPANSSSGSITQFPIASGTLLLPDASSESNSSISTIIPQTEAGVVTINTRAKSAIARSTIHPDVNNQPVIDTKSEQLRISAGSYLSQNRVAEAYKSLETGQRSLLSTYIGVNIPSTNLNINDALQEIARISKITQSPTAVVYPVVLKDRLEILVLLPTGQTFRIVEAVPEEALNALVENFRNNILDYTTPSYLTEAKLLHDILIRPIEAKLQEAKITTLVFVMDRSLKSIPAAALHDGKQFLVQKYAIATIPSLGMTNLSLNLSDRKKSSSILALGLTDSVQGYDSLPNVKIEIDTIGSKILSGTNFFNQDFTVKNLQTQKQNQDYGIIHLATHAEFVENIDDSFVLFWDEKLPFSQIPKLKLDKLELLTLSACQTAVGNNLGLSGLAVTSGVKSVLASLWSVSDAGTAPLMMKFYTNYPDALSKAIALQKAQVSLIDGTVRIEGKTIKGIPAIGDLPITGAGEKIDIKHPYYWSSFILVGNWL